MPINGIAAFFDVDRTLVNPYSMERIFVCYLIHKKILRAKDGFRYLGCWCRDIINFNMVIGLNKNNKYYLYHKNYDELMRLAICCFNYNIIPLISPIGRQRLVQHQNRGHLVVLLTGTLQPLADLLAYELKADLALAAKLEVEGNRFTGILRNQCPYGQEKLNLALTLAKQYKLDLLSSYFYADHYSDRYLLSMVGHPRAVNPHPLLRWEAIRRGWPILKF